jgi:hypothetical protein
MLGNSFVYNGSAWLPAVVDGLAEGIDYTITYTNNVNAGIATVTVEGKGNYYGSLTDSFEILEKELNAELKLADGPYVFNGSAVMPGVVDGLAEGIDYLISYTNNTNAGTATVTVTGIGNYFGTLTETFEIVPKPITVTPVMGQGKAYGTNDPILLYTIQDGTRGIELNGSLSRIAGENGGTYRITLGTLGHSNYIITFIDDVEFEITGGPIVIDPSDHTYPMPLAVLCAAFASLMIMIAVGMRKRS